jgi:hypothetical protein
VAKPGKQRRVKRDETSLRVKPKKAGAKASGAKLSSPKTATDTGIPQVEQPKVGGETALARISQLEADRTNLMAQVAWARGIASQQQKAPEGERDRTRKLEADLEAQRARIEQLKALTTLDRLLGRHKRI